MLDDLRKLWSWILAHTIQGPQASQVLHSLRLTLLLLKIHQSLPLAAVIIALHSQNWCPYSRSLCYFCAASTTRPDMATIARVDLYC